MELKDALTALSALAQDTRLAVFRLLVVAGPEGLPVARIGAAVKSSPATLSFHLKELVHAGLIQPRQEGRQIFYSAAYVQMNDLLRFLTENCCAQSGATTPCGPDGDLLACMGDTQVSRTRKTPDRQEIESLKQPSTKRT